MFLGYTKNECGYAAIPLIIGVAVGGAAYYISGSLLAAGLAFTVGAAIGSYMFPVRYGGNEEAMKPASVSDFQITQTNEATPVPVVYGTVKIPANIVWFGNLEAEEVTEEAEGGKGGGGGGGDYVVGYRYYLDIWQVLAKGKIEILLLYKNEKKVAEVVGQQGGKNLWDVTDPELEEWGEASAWASNEIWNDGTNSNYPTEPGEYATPLKGWAHLFWKRALVAYNSTYLPNLHFVVHRILPDDLPYADLQYGANPAAVIYDLLVNEVGFNQSEIDLDSFIQAAAYFKGEDC